MKDNAAVLAVESFGRHAVITAIRAAVAEARNAGRSERQNAADFAKNAVARLQVAERPSLAPVFNLTGTILHTNLGRALLAESAVVAATAAMREHVSLEFDLSSGRRGDRDDHVRRLICELTGAEDATVVNNNAAAILLVLNSLARGKETIASRGELIEIGGSFRLPAIMSQAGTKLKEVGTTNRTHEADYREAIGPRTGILLKVHTSNFRVSGFVAAVTPRELSALARANEIPFVHDLGSGALVDISDWGLSHERTVAEALKDGADIATFSGDKLLGGPQAGFVVGKQYLIEKLNRNPMKRAMRIDKIRMAILVETLKLYRHPSRLTKELPTVRLLKRPLKDIELCARRLATALSAKIGDLLWVEVIECASQIGSGTLPLETIRSAGVVIRPRSKRDEGLISRFASALRRLPIPVIARIEDRSLILDLRCLEKEATFLENLEYLNVAEIRRRVDKAAT